MPSTPTPRALELLAQNLTALDLPALNLSLRKQGEEISNITWVLQQIEFRQRAKSKLGNLAEKLFFTRNGLEQASRWTVAHYHATRLSSLESITDLGCGLGIDSLAFAQTGKEVVAVEQDPGTAALTELNLAGTDSAVIVGTAEEHSITTEGVWLDPARRNLQGKFDRRRMLGPSDFSPSLDFVFGLLEKYPGGAKLAPGLPHDLIPPSVEATWVSNNRELVELSIWNLGSNRAGRRFAVLVGEDETLEITGEVFPAPVAEIGRFLHEPDPALIRSGLIGAFAQQSGLSAVASDIAYLSSDELRESPWLRSFEILEQLPIDKKTLRKRLGELGIGKLEIKKRGIDIDPAQLRKELKVKGEGAATLILTRVGDARRALVCRER